MGANVQVCWETFWRYWDVEARLEILVHVDGASGGFVAPFVDPDLVWDFRLPRAQSINASGCTYGLVHPGIEWVVWRDPDVLPEDLVLRVNDLGGDMPTFALNFSRPGNQIAARYYNFCRRWLVPAFTFPANRQDLAALRIVVGNGFSHDLADLLVDDLRRHIDDLDEPTERHRR